MPKFFYIARDRLGKKISSTMEATSQDEVITRLQAKDLIVIDITVGETPGMLKPQDSAHSRAGRKFKHYHVSSDDLVLFCRQFATLLGSGITMLKSLDIISQQVASYKLYHVIMDLEKNVEHGLGLHEAMSRHPKVFSELWVNLVDSGEASGNLALILDRLASYLERNAQFKSKIISALIYPVLLIFFAIGALLFITLKVLPQFAELYSSLGSNASLPALTQAMLAISLFIRKFFLVFIGLLVVTIIMLQRFINTKEGRLAYEKFLFRLPMFGEFFKALVVERFSSEMSTLVESGVPIIYSLDITEKSVSNLVMADIIRQIKENVREGKSLAQPLQESDFFDPMVVQMIGIGEEIGELSQMLKKINGFYKDRVETFLARFTSLFEPFLLLFLGLIIALMVIGVFLPIFGLGNLKAS